MKMTYKSTLLLLTIILEILVAVQPSSAIIVYTAHVKWTGYNLTLDNNCGDGVDQNCEVELKVKRTTSTSTCTGRTWIDGTHETVIVSSYDYSDVYELTWTNSGTAPCLTFDVKFNEDTAGDATSTETYTISSGGSHDNANINLVIGSANGYFCIEYWVEQQDLPYGE